MKSNNREAASYKKIAANFFFIILSIFLAYNANAQNKIWTAPADAANAKNSLVGNIEILKYAQVIYATYCGSCQAVK